MIKTKLFYKTIGSAGGKKGGLARVRKGFGWMDPARRREISREANLKRWAAVRAAKEAK